MKFQQMCWLVKYLQTFGDRVIFWISLLEDWNVFALSDCIVAGNPRLLANLAHLILESVPDGRLWLMHTWTSRRTLCRDCARHVQPLSSFLWHTVVWQNQGQCAKMEDLLKLNGLVNQRTVGSYMLLFHIFGKQCNVVKCSSLSLVHVKPKIVLSRWSVLQWCLNVLPGRVLV